MSNRPDEQVVYVTKYALTKGIIEAKVLWVYHDGYVDVEWPSAYDGRMFLPKRRYEETPEAAIGVAEKMRDKRLASLRKKIERLEKRKFVVSRLADGVQR